MISYCKFQKILKMRNYYGFIRSRSSSQIKKKDRPMGDKGGKKDKAKAQKQKKGKQNKKAEKQQEKHNRQKRGNQ